MCIRDRHGSARHRFRRWRLHPDPVSRLRTLGNEDLPRSSPVRRPTCSRLAEPLDQGSHGPQNDRRVAALDVAVGPDPTDLRSLPRPEASWTSALHDPEPPARVAWSPTLGYADVD